MKDIHIIGGGLAGLTLGIGLRQKGVPVTIWEAGRYPRNRVCGEFISGKGQGVLERLGLLPLLLESQPRWAETAAFFLPHRGTHVRTLPQRALCIDRYLLDYLLAREFLDWGGQLRQRHRCTDKNFPEGVICALGRRTQPVDSGWRWFGLKAHFTQVSMHADLEVHLQPNGYVGLCRLKDGTVNVCGLFRRPANGSGTGGGQRSTPTLAEGYLRGVPGSLLHERLGYAEMEKSTFCSVAGLPLRPQRASTTECRLGDALTMISPISGNGMSLAFESAELALPILTDYSADRLSWPEALALIARRQNAAFQRRLAWTWRVQRAVFRPKLPKLMMKCISESAWIWRQFFKMTR